MISNLHPRASPSLPRTPRTRSQTASTLTDEEDEEDDDDDDDDEAVPSLGSIPQDFAASIFRSRQASMEDIDKAVRFYNYTFGILSGDNIETRCKKIMEVFKTGPKYDF